MNHHPERRRLRKVIAVIAATLCAAVLVPAAGAGAASQPVRIGDGTLVLTDKGLIKGAMTPDGPYFGGVPYAAAPVGDLRFRMPRPAQPWLGVKTTNWPRANCIPSASALTAGTAPTSEDCLYLNVHIPPAAATAGRRLPVMVWIHGGAFVFGAGSEYNGGVLARTQDAIVVTLNYRLGPFGWMVHPGLDAQARGGVSGNYGLADQQAALRWVQRNIKSFGGDPRNVTLFGESAGGGSVCAQMASPTARGLFDRAIAQSGCTSLVRSTAAARATGEKVAASVGCSGPTAAACLRLVSADKLRSAPTGTGPLDLAWAPTADRRLLPRLPAEAFRTGAFNHVPFISGTNRDEGTLLVNATLNGTRITAAAYRALLKQSYGTRAARVEATYPVRRYPSVENALAAVITDSTFACPAVRTDRVLGRQVPVYAYEFADRKAPLLIPAPFPQGAYHAAELQYVFQRTPVLNAVPQFTPAQKRLSEAMTSYWGSFAKRGNPRTAGLPAWPRASSGRLLTLAPGATRPTPLDDVARQHHCGLWAQMGT